MQTIDSPLINHAAQMAAEEALLALFEGHHNGQATPDRDVDNGQHVPATVPEPGRPVLAEASYRIDWMRPPTPVAPPTNSGVTALVTTEQALAHPEVQKEGSQPLGCVTIFADVLQRRHGISNDAATAITLAVLSAAVGPVKTIKNPLGGSVSAALNVIVEDGNNARIRRAADQALLPILQQVEKKIVAHQEAGPKHLRQARMEIDSACARAFAQLRSPAEKPREPMTIPVPAEQRKKDALAGAIEEAGEVVQRLGHHEFEERPFIVIDGLRAGDIPALPHRSFDCAILNYSPRGALGQFESGRLENRREVLRYLVAAWHRSSFVAGSHAVVAPVLTNLWLLGRGDTTRAWRNPVIASSGLLETFLVIDDIHINLDAEAFTETEADDNWRALLGIMLGERIRAETCQHQLSESAAKRFLEFHAETVRGTAVANIVGVWPEQALKIALLLHLDWLSSEVPEEIGLATMEKAIQIMERLGAAQLRLSVQNAPDGDLEAQIELMVTTIRVKGPMPKWGLFRSFHSHPADIMEPLLAQCCERNLLEIKDDLVRLSDAGQ